MSGLNFQNLKRGGTIRRSIYAPEGYVFVVSDLSQIELRLTLWLAGEHDAVQHLADGGDLYSELATELYGLEVTKQKAKEDRQFEEMRHVGKSAVLGSSFGMGGARFKEYCAAQGVKIDAEKAKQAIKLYRRTYPGVPNLWKIVEQCYLELLKCLADNKSNVGEILTCDLGGYSCAFGFDPMFGSPGMYTPSGLWLKYPNLKIQDEQWTFGEQNETRAFGGYFVENMIQNLARCAFTDKTLVVNNHYPVVLSTHDELVALAPEDKETEATEFVHNTMVAPIAWLPELPLGAETKAGIRYGDIK